MDEIRYIHAADLHLDASFVGIKKGIPQGSRLAAMLHEATFRALDNLTRLCWEVKPHFVVLAGDIYNQEERSIRAQLELRKACQKLGDMGIKVFIAHGNHDPCSSRFNKIEWPENVVIFGKKPESHTVEKNGELLALAHGVSHADSKVVDNLARMINRDDAKNCFQIGVLHCNVDGYGNDARYAPCSLSDLRDARLDAWALGHVHTARVLEESPLIAYSGCAQGLNINEKGPRGCYVVNARKDGDDWRCDAEFRALGPVRWESVALNISDIETMDALERKLDDYLENYRANCEDNVEGAIFQIRLEGSSHLDGALRENNIDADTFPAVARYSSSQPSLWIKDFEIATMPADGIDEILRRDDILGETARVAQNLLDNEEELEKCAAAALKPLFSQSSLKNLIPYPEPGQIRGILTYAEKICQDLLEKR